VIEIRAAHLIPATWNPRLIGRHYWLRLDHFPMAGVTAIASGIPADVSPVWTINGTPVRAAGSNCNVLRPTNPARLVIGCTAGGATETVTLWAISGRVVFHTSGHVSRENQRWRRGAGQAEFGTSMPPWLGIHSWPGRLRGHTNYGAWIEIVGIVEPHDVPVPFHLVRQVSHADVTFDDATQPPPEPDDTTHPSLQDQTLSPTGRVYDVDSPGSFFTASDPLGRTHQWTLNMQQMLVIGPLENASGALHRAFAQHRLVSQPRFWRARFTATVRSTGSPPTVDVNGYVGP
jgi:hypothetical protein